MARVVVAFAVSLFLMLAPDCGRASLLAQALTHLRGGTPGWKLAASKPGEVRTLYWKEEDKTEVWAHVKTERIGGPNPTTLVFFVTHEGTASEVPPAVVHLHAESDMSVEFRTPREQRLVLTFGIDHLDLIGSERVFALSYPCGFGEQCKFDAIIADLSPSEFLAVAEAREIGGNALGFDFRVRPEDMKPLVAFKDRLFDRQ
jgi:hypothetical protein